MKFREKTFYPRLFEAKLSKVKQEWKDLYIKYMGSEDMVDPKSFETLRAYFGENDGTAEETVIDFLKKSANISPDTYDMHIVQSQQFDTHAKKVISREFDAYKIVFNKSTTDIFGNLYEPEDYLIFTNRFKVNKKTGEAGVIKRKDLTPDKLGLTNYTYSNGNELLEKVKKAINNTQYPDNYKKFILESSKEILNNKTNNNKFEDFFEYKETMEPITYNISLELFEGIDQSSINNIKNDYGEVLGPLMFFNILKSSGKGLRYPFASNESLIDFYFDDYKVSSKAGQGGTPGGYSIIKMINTAYENGEISFIEKDEKEFYEKIINPWINPEKIDRSMIYNTVITLGKIHLASNSNSAYSYLLSNMRWPKDSYVKREDILKFMDALVDNEHHYEIFINEFVKKSQMFTKMFNADLYRLKYIEKRDSADNDRLGLIFYPLMVEVVKSINRYSDLLTQYTQKVTDIKQVYLDIIIKNGEFKFKSYSYKSSDFVFEQKGSIGDPLLSSIGIKMKKSK